MAANIVTMSKFGTKPYGRAGNQFLQYAFLKAYCGRYDCRLQLPKWVGNHLLESANDPPVSVTLPKYHERVDKANHNYQIPPKEDELVGHDFRGYAQYHTSYLKQLVGRDNTLAGWLRPKDEVTQRVEGAVDRLLEGDRVTIGMHIRRGDYE